MHGCDSSAPGSSTDRRRPGCAAATAAATPPHLVSPSPHLACAQSGSGNIALSSAKLTSAQCVRHSAHACRPHHVAWFLSSRTVIGSDRPPSCTKRWLGICVIGALGGWPHFPEGSAARAARGGALQAPPGTQSPLLQLMSAHVRRSAQYPFLSLFLWCVSLQHAPQVRQLAGRGQRGERGICCAVCMGAVVGWA